MFDDVPLDQLKSALRRTARARRDQLPAADRAAAAAALAARPCGLPVAPGTIVSGFMPLGTEINPLPLMRRLSAAGALLALPVVVGRGEPLLMRSWRFGEPLARGVWDIREPGPQAAEVAPDIVLAPLLAFDRRGNRIGYGAGYYDMTLLALRTRKPVLAVGLAYADQEVASVPVGSSDVRLDLVLTERETIDLRGS
jgi:5-formyltetrahydrofolate cyclo-ligase